MPEFTRPTPAADPPTDQAATIESLLVAGLDLYFAGEYDRAIHAWTRVLFLDRGHARARAYIERARQILAERQRRADLHLHGAIDAFEAGEFARARTLLDEVALAGPLDTQALALRDRLDRLQGLPPRAGEPAPVAPRPAGPAPAGPVPSRRRAFWPVVGLCVVALAVGLAWPSVVEWAATDGAPAPPVAAATAEAPLPVPRASDLLIARAQGLFSRGHLHEAATILSAIRLDDARRDDADRLLAEIQRLLLAGAATGPGRSSARPPTGPAR